MQSYVEKKGDVLKKDSFTQFWLILAVFVSKKKESHFHWLSRNFRKFSISKNIFLRGSTKLFSRDIRP